MQNFLWDLWCAGSVVGIWPRFIEPYLLKTKHLKIPFQNLPSQFRNFKIVQFSDLHFHAKIPDFFLKKLIQKISKLKPDIIVFTGDFLCRSQLEDEERLKAVLNALYAPYGCYAILGNHDYEKSVSINKWGNYSIVDSHSSNISGGFQRLFYPLEISKKRDPEVDQIDFHSKLLELLKKTTFTLLHNQTVQIPVGNSYINLAGVGEHMLGRVLAEKTFGHYASEYPGVVLAHNPDTIPSLMDFPGDLILCGHTHGGQINLPWISRKLTCLENPEFKKGLKRKRSKWIYISAGVGGMLPFRFLAMPEIVSITLENAKYA